MTTAPSVVDCSRLNDKKNARFETWKVAQESFFLREFTENIKSCVMHSISFSTIHLCVSCFIVIYFCFIQFQITANLKKFYFNMVRLLLKERSLTDNTVHINNIVPKVADLKNLVFENFCYLLSLQMYFFIYLTIEIIEIKF